MAVIKGMVGTSVLSFKYKTGVIVATGASASYGSMLMTGIQRVFRLSDNCIVAFSGKVSDIQYLHRQVLSTIEDDPLPVTPRGIHRLIQQVIYKRRNKLDLLQVECVVCGVDPKGDGEDKEGRFVGCVNSKGGFWFDDSVATQIASHLVLPILRECDTLSMSREEAIRQMERIMELLSYKDCRSPNVIQIGICEKGVLEIKEPYAIQTDWSLSIREDEILL